MHKGLLDGLKNGGAYIRGGLIIRMKETKRAIAVLIETGFSFSVN